MPNGANAAVAVIAVKKRKDLIAAFRRHGAISPATAQSREVLGLTKSPMFRLQLAKGVLVESEAERYYLDEAVEARLERFRAVLRAGALTILAVFVLWLLLTQFVR